jgi:hemerythrin-like domain-containing protein
VTANLGATVNEERVIAWGDELRRVHSRLREALRIARESVDLPSVEVLPVEVASVDEQPLPKPTAALSHDLLLFCRGFCAALTGHHESEDTRLFPQLVRDRPDLVPVVDRLHQDHRMIAHLVAELEWTVSNGGSRAETLRHLDGLEAIMESHFRYEERQLVQVLNASSRLGDASSRELFGAIA